MKTLMAVLLLLSGLLYAPVFAEEAEVKVAYRGLYGTLKYYDVQIDDTISVISDPGIFEGEHPLKFERGSGFGFTLGALGEDTYYFVGGEFEFLMSSADINQLPEGTIYENLNTLEQLSLNLNIFVGTDIGNRFFRPHIFGGIGYTEVELVGRYGLAMTSLEDGYANTFGYHAGIGADLRIFKGLYLNAGYRYYATTDAKMETRGRSIEFSNSGQMIHIGLAYIHFPPPIEYTSYKDLWRKASQ